MGMGQRGHRGRREGGEVGDGEWKTFASRRNTTCHVAKLGIRSGARKRRCNECRLQGYRGGS